MKTDFYVYEWYANGVVAPWMQHFWIQAFGMLGDTEPLKSAYMDTLKLVRNQLYKAAVGILGPNGASNYCFTKASNYNIKISNASDAATNWFDSWGEVHTATHGGDNTSCANTLEGTSGGAPASASTGYWGNLLPAIAYAVEDTATGAYDAWTRLTGATNFSTFENSGFDDNPIWGVYPRAVPTGAVAVVGGGTMSPGGAGKVSCCGTGKAY